MNEAIASLLAEKTQITGDQHFYVLVDGALQSDAWSSLSQRFRVASLIPEATDSGKSAVAALPFLVCVEGESADDAIRRTVDMALENFAATWLLSSLDLEALAGRLTRRLEGEVPDVAVMLRFADARVLPALHAALEPTQRQTFFADISGWWYLERGLQLAELHLTQQLAAKNYADPFTPPLILTAQQEHLLIEAAEPDAVLALIKQHDEQALQNLPRSQHHQFVKDHMAKAGQWGIASPVNQALFCMIALDPSSGNLGSDAWQAQLQQVKSKRITLMQALEQMTS